MSKRKDSILLPLIVADWTVGRRVSRPDGSDTGIIIEASAHFKVKWDSGKTSHYNTSKPANVRLDKKDADEPAIAEVPKPT